MGTPGQILKEFGRVIMPPRCLCCDGLLDDNATGVLLCLTCEKRFEKIVEPYCRLCGMPLEQSKEPLPICGSCLKTSPNYTMCRSLFHYNEVMQQLILQFKFRRDLAPLKVIEYLCRRCDFQEFLNCDIVIPVPLHPARLRFRSYNQSLLLSRLFFKQSLDKISPNLLQRVKNTIPQSRLTRGERRRNLEKVFKLTDCANIEGKKICLIDDVITTGSTVEECSKTLMKSGCSGVYVLSLARV